mgnify:CR=1 FL=1
MNSANKVKCERVFGYSSSQKWAWAAGSRLSIAKWLSPINLCSLPFGHSVAGELREGDEGLQHSRRRRLDPGPRTHASQA